MANPDLVTAVDSGLSVVSVGVDDPERDGRTVRVRSLFPSADVAVQFDHASVGPISVRVADAMSAVVGDYVTRGFQNTWRDEIEDARREVARLVYSSPGNIAFTQNTSTGLSIAANGLAWTPGDNVVLPDREFPSNHYPWLNLDARGVQLRKVPVDQGHASLDGLAAAIDARTRVVTLSAVQFFNGYRYDLDAIGELCDRHGLLFVVDGTQAAGALTIDVDRSGIDVLAVSSHKWMLGPSGIGFVHLSERALGHIRPDIVGWLSVTEPFAFDYRLTLPPTADRFEPGTENVVGIIGLGAAASLFLECGPRHVENRVLTYADEVRRQLIAHGCTLLSPADGPQRSGIVIFTTPTISADQLHQRLAAADIRCAPRGGGVRFSPHFYNNDDDLARAMDVVATAPNR
jgi:selenocysteine lyase/cysteine desulfurase